MPSASEFTVQTHAEIRTAILADLRSSYLALGYDIDIARDADAYNLADAFAFPLELLQARALQLTREIFPDTASHAALERHAALIGLTRKAATKAQLKVLATCSGTVAYLTTDKLTTSDGRVYAPTANGSITTSGLITLEAAETGASGNKAANAVFTWVSAPAGMASTALWDSAVVVAVDAESDAALARRVLSWWRERPGGGNRADWKAWCESYAGVDAAFVYPLRSPTLGDGTLGCVQVVILGPAPTTLTDAGEPQQGSRVLGSGIPALVKSMLVGTGDYASVGGLATCDMDPADISIVNPTEVPTNVNITLTMAASYAFTWSGTRVTDTGSTTTVIKVTASVVGTIEAGDLISISDPAVRGKLAYRRVASVSTVFITIDEPLSVAPTNGLDVRPLPPNASAIRDAVLAVFDSLGPGENTASLGSERFPSGAEGEQRGVLYRSVLEAACLSVPGVLAATVTTPGGNVTAAVQEMVVLDTLLLVP